MSGLHIEILQSEVVSGIITLIGKRHWHGTDVSCRRSRI